MHTPLQVEEVEGLPGLEFELEPDTGPFLSAVYFVLFIVEYPLMALRYLTIPGADCG
jgi:hypothetical protein